MKERKITTLYEHLKDTPKKLKIICDWDEVIQPCEPYALWLTIREQKKMPFLFLFSEGFEYFWEEGLVNYSSYGSSLKDIIKERFDEDVLKRQQEIKNSPNFYQESPFLTIAEDLLKLLREDKIESLIFLVYREVDDRAKEIFEETFSQFTGCFLKSIDIYRMKKELKLNIAKPIESKLLLPALT